MFGWINPKEYSFQHFLLLEEFQIRLMFENSGWKKDKESWQKFMGIALAGNPAVAWYFKHRAPKIAHIVDALVAKAPTVTADELWEVEQKMLVDHEDFTIHTTPEKMATGCDYIRGWDKKRLFDLADFEGKVVLDIGAGSGRLTFAAAEHAGMVYAVEPVGTLRKFLREEIKRKGITNVRVTDGFVENLPYPDGMFDIVMSGHVIGDDLEKELAEKARVCKVGGVMLNVPGDSEFHIGSYGALVERGWEEMHYVGSYGKDVHVHRLVNICNV
jgi:SAM-dependent methyltransferase